MSKKKIYIAGHAGMLGSAILRIVEKNDGYDTITKKRQELNLKDQQAVNQFFESEKPDIVILAAAKVGGIQANIDNPATFLFDNLSIQNNVINAAYLNNTEKFVFLGSSCIYPRNAPQPMKEEYLLTGTLEPTNEGYAIAKIAGLKLVEGYRKQYGFNGISLMPCNLYGTNDSFHPEHSHVLSALVRKFVEAAEKNDSNVTVWGTGSARREFMHVDDAARATLFFMENYNETPFLNVGWGDDVSIKELAEIIAEECNFKGDIIWDSTKPDGMPRKCMDVSRMKTCGFEPLISLREGIRQTIQEFKQLKTIGGL